MKEINKDKWTVKLLSVIYDKWVPKNTCQYYSHLFLAIITLPFGYYAKYVDTCLTPSNYVNLDLHETKKVTKWEVTLWGLACSVLFYVIYGLLTVLVFSIIYGINKTNLSTNLFWIITNCAFLFGPILIKGIWELLIILKAKFCKPIKFV